MSSPEATRYEWELENERARMLRRRFLWFSGTLIVVTLLSLPFGIWASLAFGGNMQLSAAINSAASLIQLAVLVLAFGYARRQNRREKGLYALAFWLVVGLGLLGLLTSRVTSELEFDSSFRQGFESGREMGRQIQDRQGDAQAQTAQNAANAPAGDGSDGGIVTPPRSVVVIEAPSTETAIRIGGGPVDDVPGARANPPARVVESVAQGVALFSIWFSVFSTHVLACLFLPWTVREAWRPALWLLGGAGVLIAVDMLLGRGSVGFLLGGLILLPIAPLPGVGWCWWRHSAFRDRFRFRFESDQFRKLHRELDGARRIHESSLPRPRAEGPVRFSYVYEPMQQIGGDVIFVHPADPCDDSTCRRHTMILLDVTGHGIAAALTVNRLVGELERLFAERPGLSPAETMAALNRYVYLTIATHGVFVTGVAASVDVPGPQNPQDPGSHNVWSVPHELIFTSAGHPPAFLRRQDGSLEPLDSDTTMLGVLPPELFEPHDKRLDLMPGDALVAYTDGATEAANEEGEMIGIDGVRRLIDDVARSKTSDAQGRPLPPDPDPANRWPDRLIRRVAAHRQAPPADDTLIALIYRPAVPDVAEDADAPSVAQPTPDEPALAGAA
jgi:hypothetical protein